MKAIVIAFTLKGQPFEAIKKQLEKLSAEHRNSILIHGFMPRKEVQDKGFSTQVVDTLADLFPVQLNMYMDGKPLRGEMLYIAEKLDATVYIVGHVIDGVKEESDMYNRSAKISYVHHIPLED